MFVMFFNYMILMENLSKIFHCLHYQLSIILVNMIKVNFSTNMCPFYLQEQFITILLKLKNLKYSKKSKLRDLILISMKLNKYFMKAEILQKYPCLSFQKKAYKKMDKDPSNFMDMVFYIL